MRMILLIKQKQTALAPCWSVVLWISSSAGDCQKDTRQAFGQLAAQVYAGAARVVALTVRRQNLGQR